MPVVHHIDEDIFGNDDQIIRMYCEPKGDKVNVGDVVEVWEVFKEFLYAKLKEPGYKKYKIGKFVTMQRKVTRLDTRILGDKNVMPFLVNYTMNLDKSVGRREKQYESIYGGMSKEEIQERSNED